MNTLGTLIQTHRKKAALTQAQLAALAGVGKTVIWDLEHGKESVQWDTLQKIFGVLAISVEWKSPLLQRMEAAAAPTPESASGSPAAPPSPKRKTAS